MLLPCFIEIHALNANSVDPDQTPRSVASDLGLHCLPLSQLGNARHRWVDFNNNVRKRAFWNVRPTKTQISLRILAVWSEYLLSAWWTLTIRLWFRSVCANTDKNFRYAHTSSGTFFSDVATYCGIRTSHPRPIPHPSPHTHIPWNRSFIYFL